MSKTHTNTEPLFSADADVRNYDVTVWFEKTNAKHAFFVETQGHGAFEQAISKAMNLSYLALQQKQAGATHVADAITDGYSEVVAVERVL